jgi:hypothetical protein
MDPDNLVREASKIAEENMQYPPPKMVNYGRVNWSDIEQ